MASPLAVTKSQATWSSNGLTITKIKAKLPALKDQARQKLAKLMKIELDEVRAKQAPTLSIKERLKPAITKLVQEVLDEMGPQ